MLDSSRHGTVPFRHYSLSHLAGSRLGYILCGGSHCPGIPRFWHLSQGPLQTQLISTPIWHQSCCIKDSLVSGLKLSVLYLPLCKSVHAGTTLSNVQTQICSQWGNAKIFQRDITSQRTKSFSVPAWHNSLQLLQEQLMKLTHSKCPLTQLLSTLLSVAIYCISLTSSTHSSLLSGILHLISLATSKRCISRSVNPSFLQLLSSHKRTYKEVSNMLRPKASGLALQTLQKYFLLMFWLILKKLMVCGHQSHQSNAPWYVSSLPFLTTLWMHLWCRQISHILADCTVPSFLQVASYNAHCAGNASRNTFLTVAVYLVLSSACSV